MSRDECSGCNGVGALLGEFGMQPCTCVGTKPTKPAPKTVRIALEKASFAPGCWEYVLEVDDGSWVASGLAQGSKREAREEATAHAKQLGYEVARARRVA